MKYEIRCYGAPYGAGEFVGQYPTLRAARAAAHDLGLNGSQRAVIIDRTANPITDITCGVRETITADTLRSARIRSRLTRFWS